MVVTFVKQNWKWLIPAIVIIIFFLWNKEKNKPVAKRIDDIKQEAKT